MTQEKPPCTDFIIAAIRRLRPKSAKGHIIGLHFCYLANVVLELYSENDFRLALNFLIESELVVVYHRWSIVKRTAFEWLICVPMDRESKDGKLLIYVATDGLPPKYIPKEKRESTKKLVVTKAQMILASLQSKAD